MALEEASLLPFLTLALLEARIVSPSLPWNYLDRSRQPIRIAKEMSGKQRNLRFYDMSMELSLPKVRVPHGEPDSKGRAPYPLCLHLLSLQALRAAYGPSWA